MPIRKTPSAQSLAAEAQKQLRELQSALRSARASLASINRGINAPKIKTPRHKIPKSTSGGLSLLEDIGAKGITGLLTGEVNTGSFYRSANQTAAQILNTAIRGQRIR